MSRLPKKPVWAYRHAYEEEVRQLIKRCHARHRAAQAGQVSNRLMAALAIFFLFSVVFNIFK